MLAADGAGVHVAAENPAALADAVRDLADNEERCHAFGHRARAAVARHTRERQAKEMLHVLHLAAAGRGANAGEGSAPNSSNKWLP